MTLLIANGRILDPGAGIDQSADLMIEDGRVVRIAPGLAGQVQAGRTIDAAGLLVVPGLIDMHTHLREPGHEYKETIATGARAAAAGGFTSIVCMANTDPVNDTAAVTNLIVEKARREACVNVFAVGAITKGLQGRHLTEMGELREAGCVAVSDDGMTISDSAVMRLGIEYARSFGLPLLCHCQDHSLTAGGVMNEGVTSMHLGLRGMPPLAEDIVVARDIALAAWCGHTVHISHVSTAGATAIIREAKARGIAVTAETAPHYFTLTDEAVSGFDTSTKMYPPLRSVHDREAVREGLRDGTIDAIASDHAPHSSLEKDVEFDRAAFGILGLETSLALGLKLVQENMLTLHRLIEACTAAPARILGLAKGSLQPGSDADVTIIDPGAAFIVDKNQFRSKSRNTPFHGWHLKGRAVCTIVGGRVVYELEPPDAD